MRRVAAWVATIVSVALICGGFAVSAAAEEPNGKFMVSPAKLEFKAVPGQTERVMVKVANQGNVPLHISTKINDYAIAPDGAFTFTEPGHESYSSSSWVSVDAMEFDLSPGELREVEIVLTTPKTAELGGHYAAVLFSSSGKASDGTGVQIVSQVGTLVLATVGNEADIVRSAHITSYDMDASWFDRTSAHMITIENTGNVHVTARGTITITDLQGREVASVPLPEQTVLPGTEREYPAQWKTPLFGRFTATPKLEYGPDMITFDTDMSVEPVTFWIVPWHLLAALVLALGASWLWFRRARRRRRALDRAQDSVTA